MTDIVLPLVGDTLSPGSGVGGDRVSLPCHGKAGKVDIRPCWGKLVVWGLPGKER